MSVTTVDFDNFVAADNNTATAAGINMTIAGEIMGDCGDETTVTAYMTGAQGSSYNFTVTDDFYAAGGMNIYQEVDRDSDVYTLVVYMEAGDDAESVEAHQNRTSGVGYNNYLNDRMQATGTTPNPACAISQQSIELVSYEEIDEWRGNILATYKGMVRAEASCTDLTATLKIKNSTSETNFNNTLVELVPTGDDLTYTWTGSLEAPNDKEDYVGRLTFVADSNDATKVNLDTANIMWTPPCYLEVLDFSKTDQTDSLDQLRTILEYHISLDHHGDEACTTESAQIALQQGGIDNFIMTLDDSDLMVALSDTGFTVSIQTEVSSSAGARISYSADDAVATQNATAAGHASQEGFACIINVVDFCLDSASEVSDGRWAFDFNIRVEHNSQCGALTASIDMIKDSQNYFANVAVDGDQIIDAFNCQCEKVFTVTADYNGAPGEIYGQIDIRDGQQNVVQVMDSCTFEV